MDPPARIPATAVGAFLLALVPLALLPFAVPYWPGEDSPNHFAVAHILAHYDDPGTPWRVLFATRLGPKPYVGYYYLAAVLGRVLDLATVDKLLTAAATVVLSLSSAYLVHALAPRRWANAFLLLPLTGSAYLLNRGFGPFVWGIAAGLFAVGLLVRQRRGATPLAAVVLLVATLFHPYATVIALGLTLGWCFAAGRRDRLWTALVVALPSIALCAAHLVALRLSPLALPVPAAICSAPFHCPGIRPQWPPLVLLSTLVSLSTKELLIRGTALLLLARGCLTRIDDAETRNNRTLLSIVLAVFALLPFGVAQRAYHLPDRLLLPLYVLAAASAVPPFTRSWKRSAATGLTLAALLAAVQYPVAARESAHIDEIVRAGRTLPRGATLAYLPFELRGAMAVAQPEQFAWGYLTIERDIVTGDLFADGLHPYFGAVGYRPLVYRDPDLLPWMSPDLRTDELAAGATRYDFAMLVAPPAELRDRFAARFPAAGHEGRVWIYRTREVTPATRTP
jgi:hypothetical protein